MVPTLALVALLTFMLLRLVPGDTLTAQILSSGQGGPQYDQQRLDEVKKQLGINGSIPSQLLRWSTAILRGDFQRSFVTNIGTLRQFTDRLGVTFELGVLAIFFSLCIGIPIGVVSAVSQDSIVDYVGRFIAVLAMAVPNFWIALLAVVFSARLFRYAFPTGSHPFFSQPYMNLQQFVVPALVVALGTAGVIMRLTRGSLLEILRQDYIRTARSKGLGGFAVIQRHALKNALIPVVTVIGAQLSSVIAGAVIAEQVFNLRGVGLLTITSVSQRDYPQIQTNILIFALALVVGNLLTDLVYGWLDPRIRY